MSDPHFTPGGWRQRFVARVLEPLGRLQIAHPFAVLAVALASVLLALFFASRLTLKTDLGELLPENKRSVIVAEEVNERLPAISNLGVVAEGSDNEGLKRFVDALAPELRKIGPPLVGVVDEGIQESRRFLEDNRFLYAPLDLVQEVHDEVIERYEYEVGKKAGLLLDEEEPPPPLTEESIRERLEKRADRSGVVKEAKKRFPGGYYLDEDKHVAVILVRTPIGSADIERTAELKRRVREAIDRVEPKRFDPRIRVGFTGNLVTSAETREQIESDLRHVGVWGVALILGVVFLYYLRLRALVTMTLAVGIGASWTFGVAYLLVGHLNSSTGFLFSIVVGNGINFGIIYMARYMEARRTADAPTSIAVAHRETWLATLAAAGAAGCAYGSLAVTDFRGFKHFGIIGGSGMLLCWLATYLFLPAILVVFERLSPLRASEGLTARLRGFYGRPFAYLAHRFPRALTLVALVITSGSAVLAYRYLRDDPMEYNMREIDNEALSTPSESKRLGRLMDPIVGRQGVDGLALATERIDQVLPLKAELLRRRDAAPADAKPFESVTTIHSLMPEDQEAKLALVRNARDTLANAHKKGFIEDDEWKKVDDLIPEERLRVIGIAELPEQVARPFTEKDGTRGRLVYVTPNRSNSVWDGHYLIRWAEAIRTIPLPDGSVVEGSGRSVIFADVILAVISDAPKAIIASLATTLLLVLFAFRGRATGIAVVLSLLVGVAWTVSVLAVYNSEFPWGETGQFAVKALKLNFLNFVALPITIGVGADYAVNVMQRYEVAGGQIERVVVETGGAVILCSLTTTLGYFALTLSVNRAVQSFGWVAAAGELCTLVTAVLILPAALLWIQRARRGEQPAVSRPAPTDPSA